MSNYGMTATLAAVLLGLSGSLAAAPITVNDDYVGSDAGTYGDVVGEDDYFDISSMVVAQNGSQFDFTVNTNFAGQSGTLFNDLTLGGTGIGYGDLFLANQWTPEQSVPTPGDNSENGYDKDDATNGTKWTWGLMLSDRYENGGGDVTLFQLLGTSNLDTAILSDQLMTGGAWRYGQEVTIKDGNQELVVNYGSVGSWSLGTGQLNISADLASSDLMDGDSLAFHWGMTCANDVIEGEVDLKKVPEPGTIGLVSLALAGMFIMRRRSKAA
ncbi:PEP-CTERM sorting domain-containing protein [Marinobacter sp.]|uniref:PEP-CTERM sorting domain-containing protein n=1 Tax=Marinobacter sp. TaxID=50741 RepID=UPI003568CA83